MIITPSELAIAVVDAAECLSDEALGTLVRVAAKRASESLGWKWDMVNPGDGEWVILAVVGTTDVAQVDRSLQGTVHIRAGRQPTERQHLAVLHGLHLIEDAVAAKAVS